MFNVSCDFHVTIQCARKVEEEKMETERMKTIMEQQERYTDPHNSCVSSRTWPKPTLYMYSASMPYVSTSFPCL